MFGGVIVNCCFCFVVVFFGFGFGRVQVLQCLSQDVLLFIKRSMCEREREREMFSGLTRMHVLAWAAL